MRRLESEAALTTDVTHLMGALPPLANVLRYGDVRNTDTTMIGHAVRGIVATLLWWKAEEACRTVCRRIHQILKADRRFTRVKWHTENEWNTDPETDWSEAP